MNDAAFGSAAARFLKPSNSLTYAALLLGMLAVAGANATRSPHLVGLCLALVVLADTFDGRFARLFQRTSAERSFGVQLDSLTDAVALGLAPVAAMGMVMPAALPALGLILWWGAAFMYLVSAITRLGFYNLHEEVSDDFMGMPTPLSALVCASMLLFTAAPYVLTGVVLSCAVLMVAPLPIRRPRGPRLAIFVLWTVAVGGAHAGLFLTR